MTKISLKEYNEIPNYLRGVLEDINGKNPELKGKKTAISHWVLGDFENWVAIEGVDFEIY